MVVDNRLAFIGGLDLCFGRYDTHSHSLSDYPAEGHDREVFPGQDYSNPRVKDFVDGKLLVSLYRVNMSVTRCISGAIRQDACRQKDDAAHALARRDIGRGRAHCQRHCASFHPTMEFPEIHQKHASSQLAVFDAQRRVRGCQRRGQFHGHVSCAAAEKLVSLEL